MKQIRQIFSTFFTVALLASAFTVSNTVAAGNTLKQFVLALDGAAGELLSKSQTSSAENPAADSIETKYGVSLVEEFRSDEQWYQVVKAKDQSALSDYLGEVGVKTQSITESQFVNSPVLAGGPKAGDKPRDGHTIYVIERGIPGAGLLPMETKTKISAGSQSVIEKIGDGIEWDHSYMTESGTFCVYRTSDKEKIYEHGKIANAPVDRVVAVEHIVRGLDFGEGKI